MCGRGRRNPLQPLQIQVGVGGSEVWPAEKGGAGKKERWRGRVSRGKPKSGSGRGGGLGAGRWEALGQGWALQGCGGEAGMGVQRQPAWRPTGRLMGK